MPTFNPRLFESFGSWSEVLEHACAGTRLYYHASLDRQPSRVEVTRVFKNGKLRIDPLNNSVDPFTADESHLDRMKREVSKKIVAWTTVPAGTPIDDFNSYGDAYLWTTEECAAENASDGGHQLVKLTLQVVAAEEVPIDKGAEE